MGVDKRGGNYGFLRIFDWNSKSRKKLFPSKHDIPEQSKQKKTCEGNLSTSLPRMRDDNEVADTSGIKGSGEFTCADENAKAPGVVARLMGLDCLPKCSVPPSLGDANHQGEDQIWPSTTFQETILRDEVEQKYEKLIKRPTEKFQTEVLPPRSAKSIPVTSHKLLSPIKRASYIPPEDAAHIMEAAARITKRPPQELKFPLVGSSSVPLKVKDLKEKVEVPQTESSDKSWSGSPYGISLKVFQDLQQPSFSVKNKEGSISMARQAKANVQKKNSVGLSSRRGSGVLRQNNQKQNGVVVQRGELSSTPNQKYKVGSKEESYSSSGRANNGKRSIDGSYHLERNPNSQDTVIEKTGETFITSSIMVDHSSSSQDIGLDVVSFTFTASMKCSCKATEVGDSVFLFSACPQSKRSDNIYNPKYPSLGQDVKRADALSDLLEQKLNELHSSKSGLEARVSLNLQKTVMDSMDLGQQESSCSSISEARKSADCRVPSPISVLLHSSGSKQFSSIQTLKASSPTKGDADLSDSASSTPILTVVKRKQVETEKPNTWENEYVKEMLCNINLAYKDYALGRASDVVSPCFFHRLENSRKWNSDDISEVTSRMNQRILFDCVNEIMDRRFKHFVSGGYKLWAKDLYIVRGKKRLAGEIYKEIYCWPEGGDTMVDELVDKDMSSQHGSWLETDIESFELGIQIECRILNTLIDEAISERLVHNT